MCTKGETNSGLKKSTFDTKNEKTKKTNNPCESIIRKEGKKKKQLISLEEAETFEYCEDFHAKSSTLTRLGCNNCYKLELSTKTNIIVRYAKYLCALQKDVGINGTLSKQKLKTMTVY
ncbi:hypothetical protein CDIK_1553 [Cucumispora dikerogammari]|nr:hypothetical protein CDIK_1553 [Cucumispora dikerogammari]